MSGNYDLLRFLKAPPTADFSYASPAHWLRERFVLLASGEGRAEGMGEPWRVAHVLGTPGDPQPDGLVGPRLAPRLAHLAQYALRLRADPVELGGE